MRYAENPPKRYEDIVNPDFTIEDARDLWSALRDVAGMLRSLDYAARTADAPPTWLAHARAEFLDGSLTARHRV
jgi:predicted trehalose synthase